MTVPAALLVVVGGAIGAVARHLIDAAVARRLGAGLPWGTWSVNVLGSAVLGVVAAGAAAGTFGQPAVTLVGTGICGALTTFSTFGYQTLRLVEAGAPASAALNVAGSVLAGLLACTLAWDLAAGVLGG